MRRRGVSSERRHFSCSSFYGRWGGEAWVHFRSYRSFVQCIECHFDALCTYCTHSGFYPCVAGWKDLRSLRTLPYLEKTVVRSPAYLKSLSRTSQISGTCPLPGVVVMTEPSSVHLGPSGSVPETTSMTSQGPQLLPSSVKDPLWSSSTPCGAVWEFPAADMPFAACTGGLSAVSHAEHRGSDLVHVWLTDRACRHFLSLFRHLMPALG